MSTRYQLLSIAEVAEQLGRARWFVYKEIDKKRLAFHLIGGRRCVSQHDLDAYVERARVAALGEKGEKKTKAPLTTLTV